MSDTVVPETAVAVREKSAVAHFDANDPAALYMQPTLFDQLQRVAKLMASSGVVPDNLKNNVADCFLVAAQAFRWRMDPFSVAQSCYVLKGKLGYEGKLIAAVVNANPALKTKLNYEYGGKGAERWIRVFGTLKGEDTPREVVGTVAAWKTTNGQWNTQVDQMLSYRGAREWARRHLPEAILGIYADEEVEVIAAQAPTVVKPESLADFTGEVISASNDPKEGVRKPKPEEPVDAEVVAKVETPEDAELLKMFGK